MNVSYGQNATDNVSGGLKVVLNRIPFGDRTNDFLMPVENKCNLKDMKTNRQSLKKNKPYGENVTSFSKSSTTKNNSVLIESVKKSTYIPVPEVMKGCKVILERLEVPEVVNSSKVVTAKPTVPEVVKSCKNITAKPKVPEVNKRCKVILERTEVSAVVNSCKVISEKPNIPKVVKSCKVILERSKARPNDEKEIRLSTPLVNRLRKCNDRNYLESSLECSTVEPSKIEDKNTPALKQKIPIYKQNIEKCKENEKDPYTLDIFDLDGDKPDKPKRGRNLNDSRKFNKTIYDLLEKLDKKDKKVVKKKTLSNNIPKYTEKINDVLKKVMNKVNDRKKIVTKVVPLNGSKHPPVSDNLSQRNRTVVTVGFGKSNLQRRKVPNQETHPSIPTALPQGDTIENVSVTNRVVKETKEVATLIESISGYENESGFLGFNNTDNHLNTPTIDQPNNNINIISVVNLRPEMSPFHLCDDNQSDCCSETDCNDNDQFFGFGEEWKDGVVNLPHKIIESPAYFSRRRPNANSTMIGGALKSPWRLSVPGKRSTHFLLMKNNSLPSLNQDVVLDYSVIEESELQVKSRYEEVERPKSPVQTSILDFVEGSTAHDSNKTQENMRRSSLFDYEDFVITKPRRKVLGVLQNNVLCKKQTESTPRKVPLNLIGSPNISAVGNVFHDFDTTDEESKENKKPSSRPFRIDVRDIRKYKKNIQVEEEAESPITEKTVVEQNEMTEEQDTTEVDNMQLFGDFDSKQEVEMSIQLPKFTYGKKRRRKRLLSIARDESGEPKKKKKDMMTKAELDAFEKWAQDFNSMCKEVEEHQLEID